MGSNAFPIVGVLVAVTAALAVSKGKAPVYPQPPFNDRQQNPPWFPQDENPWQQQALNPFGGKKGKRRNDRDTFKNNHRGRR